MKKINLINLMMMAMMAIVCVTFAACGGDDDDDPGKDGATGVGVHRIDVQFSTTQASNLDCQCAFAAFIADGKTIDIYENGKIVSQGGSIGIEKSANYSGIRDISVSSDKGCVTMEANMVLMTNKLIPAAADVTVTFVAYVNGNRVKTQVATLPKGKKMMTVVFGSGRKENTDPVID